MKTSIFYPLNFVRIPVVASAVTFLTASFAGAADVSDAKWQTKAKLRVDAVQSATTTKDGEKDASTSMSSQIKLNRAQFEFVGKKDSSEFRLKYYADKNYLKYALVNYKFSDLVVVSVG